MGKVIKTVGKVASFGLSGLGPAGLVGGLVGGTILNSLFHKKPKKAEPAAVPDPVMPLPDDEAVKAAKRRSIIEQMGRGGRSSTILTDDPTGSKLGG